MPDSLPQSLAPLHARVRSSPALARFTLMNRVLLAMAFVPTGLVKALGQRFTSLPVENPIGFFFEAMYRTGAYWHFIGFAQLAAGLLLLLPRTAFLGAVLALPIAVSITLITIGIGFGGTPWVTSGILLSVVYLLCWDADRVWSIAATALRPRATERVLAGMGRIETIGWALGAATGIALFLTTRDLLPAAAVLPLLVVGCGAFALVVTGWIVGGVRTRRAARVSSSC